MQPWTIGHGVFLSAQAPATLASMNGRVLEMGQVVELFGLPDPNLNHCIGKVIGFQDGEVGIELLPAHFELARVKVPPHNLRPVQLDTDLIIPPAVDFDLQSWLHQFKERARHWHSEFFQCAGQDFYLMLFMQLATGLQRHNDRGTPGTAFKRYTLDEIMFGAVWLSGESPEEPVGEFDISIDYGFPGNFPKEAFAKSDTESVPCFSGLMTKGESLPHWVIPSRLSRWSVPTPKPLHALLEHQLDVPLGKLRPEIYQDILN